jgi:hypothetical protein
MTADRELLEAAAKAAGMSLAWDEKYKLGDDIIDCTDIPYVKSNQPDEADMYWNPLTDDGDALRLAVKADIDVVQMGDATRADYMIGIGFCTVDVPHGDDPLAATRRAIVRAAAEIGRSMK